MENRNKLLFELRGITIGNINENCSLEEIFQNETLRPILKSNNNLFIASFKNYINKHKSDFKALSVEKKLGFIENAIQRDIKYRNALKGMVLAWFTLSEFDYYITNSSKLNKRMMNLLIERLRSQVQLFESV
ncbi:glyoxalase [uncultured Flavobacterium sp.]|uniref:glyoxalase n=1 Tax=uncultured Flavobacterium sp. TaxID=165435 RepID=UPI0030CA139E